RHAILDPDEFVEGLHDWEHDDAPEAAAGDEPAPAARGAALDHATQTQRLRQLAPSALLRDLIAAYAAGKSRRQVCAALLRLPPAAGAAEERRAAGELEAALLEVHALFVETAEALRQADAAGQYYRRIVNGKATNVLRSLAGADFGWPAAAVARAERLWELGRQKVPFGGLAARLRAPGADVGALGPGLEREGARPGGARAGGAGRTR